MKPKRIQRKRSKGWTMPENTVYVGKGSKWGNPFRIGKEAVDAQDACNNFRFMLTHPENKNLRAKAKFELKGKNLACWCALDKPCHADVLLEIVNSEVKN